MKPITATEAIKKMNLYKQDLQRVEEAQIVLKEKLKEKNKEIESLKKQLREDFPNLLKKYKSQRKLLANFWVMSYLEGE